VAAVGPFRKTFFCLGTALALASAQPIISADGIANAASYGYYGVPKVGIAQGALFVIFGTGLGPSALVQTTSFPIATNLGGTSVQVIVNGATFPAPIIYTLAAQVAAILPSNTPVGPAQVTVTYNAVTSLPKPVNIVTSAFGIFTVNQAGTGRGVITDLNYHVFDLEATASAGDLATIWGTGLGPAPFDDSAPPQATDRQDIPVEVVVGDIPARVIYRGRSGCCAGLDQIVFIVPDGVEGCYVPVVVKIGALVSNSTTMAITYVPDRVCYDLNWFSGRDIQNLAGRPFFSLGYNALGRAENSQGNDHGFSTFYLFNTVGYDFKSLQPPVYGACAISTGPASSNSEPARLDAGKAINISGPNGVKQSPRQDKLYWGDFGTGYLVPGLYTLDNGSGGSNVGPFRMNLEVPQPFTWVNRDQIGAVSLADGFTLRWSGGDPHGSLKIIATTGKGSVLGGDVTLTQLVCHARVSDGSFVVPPSILLGMIPDQKGDLSLSVTTNRQRFTASGLDLGFASFDESVSRQVTFR
jgi:uncharacterized protein (TIGR03437 family)